MIRGATALAKAFNVPPVVIGLTIVAFGTSAPELVVNCTAAFSHQTELAFGNIVGSCTINLGWVLALTALIKPIKVERSIISREIPMMLLGTAVFLSSPPTSFSITRLRMRSAAATGLFCSCSLEFSSIIRSPEFCSLQRKFRPILFWKKSKILLSDGRCSQKPPVLR